MLATIKLLRLLALLAALSALGSPLAGCRCSPDAGALDLSGVDRSDGVLPELVAPRLAGGTIKIDGRLDEAGWKHAGDTGPFVGPGDGRPRPGSKVNAKALVTWDHARLFLGFIVHDGDPAAPFSRDDVDPHLWERASAVELMIQPGDPGNNRHYYELQVDTAGAVWDTRFDDYNRPITGRPGARRFGHQAWKSGVERAAVIERGRRYTLELAIPWGSLRGPSGGDVAVPPRDGDRWRINLYSFRDGQRDALAWSPILGKGNFHRAARFGRVRFVTSEKKRR